MTSKKIHYRYSDGESESERVSGELNNKLMEFFLTTSEELTN